jgi:hypothetical protein
MFLSLALSSQMAKRWLIRGDFVGSSLHQFAIFCPDAILKNSKEDVSL